ncbi:hypothetical protein A5714_09115, partial [Mycobacterium sp. E2462]|uniref:hypothetical protein n=1 Tax=Mycobacterium sp. E2462 TaxID=1834133 RepID=UPI0007FF2220
MTGPHPEAEGDNTRPISVAELLARNGTIGAPAVTRRRRRRRGDSDAVTVAELTGEIPVIRDDDFDEPDADDTAQTGAPAAPEAPEPPAAEDHQHGEHQRDDAVPAPQLVERDEQAGAEGDGHDRLQHHQGAVPEVLQASLRRRGLGVAGCGVGVPVRQGGVARGRAILVEQLRVLGPQEGTHVGGILGRGLGLTHLGVHDVDRDVGVMIQRVEAHLLGARRLPERAGARGRATLVGLVVGVRVVRKTEDIASTLIAVAVS